METLFKMPRPELIMIIEDAATSDDPLEIYLQRKGWDLHQVKQLQKSISEKLTIDIFTTQTKPLNAVEIQLRHDIQNFLDTQ